MIQINLGTHKGRYKKLEFQAIPQRHRETVRWVLSAAVRLALTYPNANRYFKSLPKGRSLSQLFANRAIWINYNDTLEDYYAFTNSKLDIWLCKPVFQTSRRVILASVIHELAHINGAIGSSEADGCSKWTIQCHAAERAILECGMSSPWEFPGGADDPKTPYDPGVWG